jgi:hypothetical protein
MAETFHNAYQDVGTSYTNIVAATTGETLVVLTLRITNIDGTNDQTINAQVLDNDGTTNARIAETITVPADSTLELAGTSKLVLEAGDSIQLQTAATGDLEAFCSYLKIT